MIIGIGTDLIEIQRIQKAAEKTSFLNRVFAENELREYNVRNCRASFLAGCFAAKEAMSKAMGTGFAGFSPAEIEVLREASGKPFITLTGNALAAALSLRIDNIHISITNTAEYAAAFVVIERL